MPEADEEALEEEEKEPVPQPPQSDDTRVENMDISDEGEGPGPWGWAEKAGKVPRVQGDDLSRHPVCFPQRRPEHRDLGPQRCWRRMRRSWSCRSS